ncbi:fibronectin type III domain protein [Jatrophihabitans sp. GAS493]|uniref:Ig-like domain-containing protein n=1 Tax=Jatrophihabitans sp. GAS493 TaxID=1907575 RepID=UPI000BC099F8|nr:Ig-like domain-containing protein [Jatrophihabitans sp. GAS493]SOD72397.1 fibronectin type III domain protein [Jatrophihabitans sp. GAS493]
MSLGGRRWLVAAGLAVCVAAGLMAAYAIHSPGYSTRHLDLNDGGIWASSDHDGLFGRVNKPAGSLDTAFYPPGGGQQNYQLDILQDHAAVLARDRASGKLYPVDVAVGAVESEKGIALSASAQVQIGGGTAAVLDPSSGKLWATRIDTGQGVTGNHGLAALGSKAAVVAELGSSSGTGIGSTLAVGIDGTVYAVSASGKVATVRQSGAGLGHVTYSKLDAALQAPQVTAVGTKMVVFDAKTGAVLLPGHHTTTITDRQSGAVLQQPGPDAGGVLIATQTTLYSVDLGDAKAATISTAGTGQPAAPVWLSGCVYAAWSGTPGVAVRGCNGTKATPVALSNEQALVQPQLRINRGAAVLNDLVSGAIWDLDDGRRLDNWTAVKPPTPIKPKNDQEHHDPNLGAVLAPPRAVDDELGARPGHSTILYVLDNDSDPGGNVLSIASVTGLDNPQASLSIAPDGQSIQLTMPGGSGDVHFSYSVDDGKGLSASANVAVTARGPGDNRPPNLRRGYEAKVWGVASGGSISLPVLGDWRDFDGDPVILAGATAAAGRVSTSPDGRVNYIAPVTPGPQTLQYTVSDGRDTTDQTLQINVLAITSSQTAPATAEPDVARGEVGQPIVVNPLSNDLPGTDPTDPDARLQLATDVASPDATVVVTDLKAGTVTLTASHAGTFLFEYTVAYGNAAYAKGAVRVDVIAPPATPQRPIAMLDSATLHGQRPVVVDVLANDFDPSGRLLVVQSASATVGNELQVAIIQGRWLRINSLVPSIAPNPQTVDYVVSDGVGASVTGQVSVSQLPLSADNTPVPQDDYATVRAGDIVTAPVLDNDTDADGDPLSLLSDVNGAPHPGQLTVTSNQSDALLGQAYVSGDVIRFVAPAGVAEEETQVVGYVVQNDAGQQSVGQLHVTIEPPPTAARPDQVPSPPNVESRATAGDTITIPIRTSEVDPDGDSVTLIGIASAPALGRIMSSTASSMVYQAYPTSSGTDTFSYQVTDRFGKTGTATIRVAVVPSSDPQPPVASDVSITAAPNAALGVDVLARAFHSPDDSVSILPLNRTNVGAIPGGASLTSPTGSIQVTASKNLVPVVVRFAVTDGIGEPSPATLTVRSQAGFDIPPVAVDDYANPAVGDNVVTVDVLSKASDPDGDASRLQVSKVFDPDATFAGGKITVPVLKTPQVVPYEISDDHGATAMAIIYVPAEGAGAPSGKADQSIKMDKNSTKTINIANFVTDPSHKAVSLTTTNQLSASPSNGLQVTASGSTQLTLTSSGNYVGPAAITFQVTDGVSLTDPAGQFGIISVPVQVGPETPVLRCPTNNLAVVEGGAPLDLDVTSLCHVWVADPAQLRSISYTASWQPQPSNVSVSGFGTKTLHVTAAGSAIPGTTGALVVGVSGSNPTPSKIHLAVVSSPPPSVSAVTVDGVVAGTSATVDLANYVSTQLRDRLVSVVSVSRSSGMGASVTSNGSQVSMTPAADAHGTITFAVTITDVADRTRTERQANGVITLHVLGVPDKPGTPDPGRTVLSRVVALSWSAPANNGEPIDFYEVDWDGGTQKCPASPCMITGLTNGTQYQFTVRAHNGVGFSQPSAASAPAQPNTVPDAATGLQTSNPKDGQLDIAWKAAQSKGTPVLSYVVSWPGGAANVTGTSATVTGLNNDAVTTIRVVAVNQQGPGPAATVTGESSGLPAAPKNVNATPVSLAGRSGKAVTVSWAPVDPNGPGPTTYTVFRYVVATNGAQTTVCSGTHALSCPDQVTNDGTTYRYGVVAANATEGHYSPQGNSDTVEAADTPDTPILNGLAPSEQYGQATITFTPADVHGAGGTIVCVLDDNHTSCGNWAASGGIQRQTITGLDNGTTTTLHIQECNSSTHLANPCSPFTAFASVTPYGPIGTPVINPVSGDGQYVNFSVSVDPNGRPVTITVTRRHSNGSTASQSFTSTATSTWQRDFEDDSNDKVGFNQSETITVTASPANPGDNRQPMVTQKVGYADQAGVQLSRSNTDCTPDATPTPEPPATPGPSPTPDPHCGIIHLKLTGFEKSDTVKCTFEASASNILGGDRTPPDDVNISTDNSGDYDDDTPRTYDTKNTNLVAVCEGVRSNTFKWT